MAEILLEPVSIRGSATFNSSAIRIAKADSKVSGKASLSVVGRILKYVKGNPLGRATVNSESQKFKTAAARIAIKSEVNAFVYDRDIRESMLGYLPSFYRDFRDFNFLINTEANEFTRLFVLLDELFYQFFIDTATFSLNDWEQAVGIQARGIRTLDVRRERVKSKVNGPGTLTRSALKSIVDSFYETEVIELPEPGTVEFKILGERGEPEDFSEIESTVQIVLPAHLQPKFTFTYLPWNELEASGLTWYEIEQFTWHELERAFLI